jgi:hypothetical protein
MKPKVLFFLSVTFLLLLRPASAGTVVSSGTATLQGTYCFNFDLGTQSATGQACTGFDVWWDIENLPPAVPNMLAQMVPEGTATIVNLGTTVDFNSMAFGDLKSLTYTTTPIDGNNDSTNQLVVGDVFAVQTNYGNYAKVKVLQYGVGQYGSDLVIQWVTLSSVPNEGQPSPVLVFMGTEDYTANGYPWTRYRLSVSNWQLYPPELFSPAPNLPPCGSNTDSSRTWVDIYAEGGRRIYGFCAFSTPQDLTQIWFAEPRGTAPPAQVYVVLTDRQSSTTYTSNLLPIEAPNPAYSPIPEPLKPEGGTNLYPFAVGNVANVFNYKVTYPALLNPPPAPVDLVLQPILISQTDLDALVAGTGFQGAQLVPYDETGGFGVLFRATCQDSSGNPVTCPLTTGPHDIKTSWNSPLGAPPITDPAFLMAPVGTHNWTNIFTDLSETRYDPTGGGRTPPTWSDFVFVQGISGTPLVDITITTPPEGALYLLNDVVSAEFSCSPAPPTPPVVACLGDVPSGSNIDTSSVGSKTFTVNAPVTAGPAGVKTVDYQVVLAKNVCLLYDPNRSVKKGAAFPIKLEVCDVAGHNLSSPSIVVHAVSVTMVSTNAPGALEDSGNANPDFDFRFDSTLGVGGGYIFNLKTTSSGTWNLNFTISGDPSTHSAKFGVK